MRVSPTMTSGSKGDCAQRVANSATWLATSPAKVDRLAKDNTASAQCLARRETLVGDRLMDIDATHPSSSFERAIGSVTD